MRRSNHTILSSSDQIRVSGSKFCGGETRKTNPTRIYVPLYISSLRISGKLTPDTRTTASPTWEPSGPLQTRKRCLFQVRNKVRDFFDKPLQILMCIERQVDWALRASMALAGDSWAVCLIIDDQLKKHDFSSGIKLETLRNSFICSKGWAYSLSSNILSQYIGHFRTRAWTVDTLCKCSCSSASSYTVLASRKVSHLQEILSIKTPLTDNVLESDIAKHGFIVRDGLKLSGLCPPSSARNAAEFNHNCSDRMLQFGIQDNGSSGSFLDRSHSSSKFIGFDHLYRSRNRSR